MEGAVASVKEEAAKAAMEIRSEQIKGLQSAQTSDKHFKWIKDASQVMVVYMHVLISRVLNTGYGEKPKSHFPYMDGISSSLCIRSCAHRFF